MKIKDDRSDALELVLRAHRELKELQQTLYELEYLVYEKDERVKIKFFGKKNDKAIQR